MALKIKIIPDFSMSIDTAASVSLVPERCGRNQSKLRSPGNGLEKNDW